MKKDIVTFLIVLFCGVIFIFGLNISYSFSANLMYQEENLEAIFLGFSNGEKLVSIDLDYDTIYIAYGSSLKKDQTFRYRNRSFEEEDLSGINSFSIYSRYPGDSIYYRDLSKNQYIELISIQNKNTLNGYSIHYQLVNDKTEETLESYNILENDNQKIMYSIEHEKKEKKNYYKISSFLKINEEYSLVVEMEYMNKNTLSEENSKELILKIFKHIHVQKKEVTKVENSTTKEETTSKPSTTNTSSEKTLLCIKNDSQSNQNCNTTYKHNLTFKNNQFAKYVMETIITCSSKENYQKIKTSYNGMKDVYFNDTKRTITYYVGNGYEGTNGNEDLFKNKNIETSKEIIRKYDMGTCEVK